MANYTVINLDDIIALDREIVSNAFKLYEPKYDEEEVYSYLNNDAIYNNENGYSKTYLLIDTESKDLIIYGYFTICNKLIEMKNISRSKKKKLLGNKYPNNRKTDFYPAYLIGQISVNNRYPDSLEKNEIMDCCIDMIRNIRNMIGCNLIILECKNDKKLTNYYKNNGFSVYSNIKSKDGLITMIQKIN